MDKTILKEAVIESAKDYVLLNGIIFKTPDLQSVQPAPVTLYPTQFPETQFQYAVRIQKDFQVLFNKVCRDDKFLRSVLKRVINTDEYLKNLWNIYETVLKEGNVQPIYLYLVRNDYMVNLPIEYRNFQHRKWKEYENRPGISLKQIEYNLMASSFAGFSQRISQLHKFNVCRTQMKFSEHQLPPNKPSDGLAKGLVCAWKLYKSENAVILFIVSPNERNVYDQRILEQSIYEINLDIRVIRRTFEECFIEGTLLDDKTLKISNNEIAVIYYRDGYKPDQFHNSKIWDAKMMLERSRAIKSPNIHQMMVNTKLVQQSLYDYSVLRRYLSDSAAHEIYESFASQYLLDDAEHIQEALDQPDDWVLKPQREGGGNNFFGAELTKKLKEIQYTDEKYEYVLMQKIFPPQFPNHLLSSEGFVTENYIVSELGIYGVFLGTDTDIYANYQCGHILRSKASGVNESGVAAGFGLIDSAFLV